MGNDLIIRTIPGSRAWLDSFHDCHVQSIGWTRDAYEFEMRLHHILEWILPAPGASHYTFRMARAVLAFGSVSELSISLDWKNAALDAEIESISIADERMTPAGNRDDRYVIGFSDLSGTIELWSTGYEVRLLSEPVLHESNSFLGNG